MGGAQAGGPTLVFIVGPPAVGKMTVGQALARRTGFRLFHLHQVLDLLTEYFEYGSAPFLRLLSLDLPLLVVDTEHLSAESAAARICEHYRLQ